MEEEAKPKMSEVEALKYLEGKITAYEKESKACQKKMKQVVLMNKKVEKSLAIQDAINQQHELDRAEIGASRKEVEQRLELIKKQMQNKQLYSKEASRALKDLEGNIVKQTEEVFKKVEKVKEAAIEWQAVNYLSVKVLKTTRSKLREKYQILQLLSPVLQSWMLNEHRIHRSIYSHASMTGLNEEMFQLNSLRQQVNDFEATFYRDIAKQVTLPPIKVLAEQRQARSDAFDQLHFRFLKQLRLYTRQCDALHEEIVVKEQLRLKMNNIIMELINTMQSEYSKAYTHCEAESQRPLNQLLNFFLDNVPKDQHPHALLTLTSMNKYPSEHFVTLMQEFLDDSGSAMDPPHGVFEQQSMMSSLSDSHQSLTSILSNALQDNKKPASTQQNNKSNNINKKSPDQFNKSVYTYSEYNDIYQTLMKSLTIYQTHDLHDMTTTHKTSVIQAIDKIDYDLRKQLKQLDKLALHETDMKDNTLPQTENPNNTDTEQLTSQFRRDMIEESDQQLQQELHSLITGKYAIRSLQDVTSSASYETIRHLSNYLENILKQEQQQEQPQGPASQQQQPTANDSTFKRMSRMMTIQQQTPMPISLQRQISDKLSRDYLLCRDHFEQWVEKDIANKFEKSLDTLIETFDHMKMHEIIADQQTTTNDQDNVNKAIKLTTINDNPLAHLYKEDKRSSLRVVKEEVYKKYQSSAAYYAQQKQKQQQFLQEQQQKKLLEQHEQLKKAQHQQQQAVNQLVANNKDSEQLQEATDNDDQPQDNTDDTQSTIQDMLNLSQTLLTTIEGHLSEEDQKRQKKIDASYQAIADITSHSADNIPLRPNSTQSHLSVSVPSSRVHTASSANNGHRKTSTELEEEEMQQYISTIIPKESLKPLQSDLEVANLELIMRGSLYHLSIVLKANQQDITITAKTFLHKSTCREYTMSCSIKLISEVTMTHPDLTLHYILTDRTKFCHEIKHNIHIEDINPIHYTLVEQIYIAKSQPVPNVKDVAAMIQAPSNSNHSTRTRDSIIAVDFNAAYVFLLSVMTLRAKNGTLLQFSFPVVKTISTT